MKIKLSIAAVILTCVFSSFTLQRSEYCNARFGFCAGYPKGFTGKGESANGDGQTFTSADGKAVILIFGALADDTDVEGDIVQDRFRTASSGYKVVYKVIKPNWFIFSGTDKSGNTVYCKTVKRNIKYMGEDPTDVFQTIMITYPPADQEKYRDYCAYIAGSLK
ncbi:hypothetical protein [Chitinophaga solisilvae]|uniref:Uncharacterized protein n=1 Tax=Chitinophaga solisilvae TaxID=1233460 RepID=A0A433WEZ3_9BACT|nr:hypothetical protein [Chitinophaga solisilvae]NSL85629.1 hypothetical protein [Chitinophaga solisilvae]